MAYDRGSGERWVETMGNGSKWPKNHTLAYESGSDWPEKQNRV